MDGQAMIQMTVVTARGTKSDECVAVRDDVTNSAGG